MALQGPSQAEKELFNKLGGLFLRAKSGDRDSAQAYNTGKNELSPDQMAAFNTYFKGTYLPTVRAAAEVKKERDAHRARAEQLQAEREQLEAQRAANKADAKAGFKSQF